MCARNWGGTLIELLIATFILSFGLINFAFLQIKLNRFITETQKKSDAFHLIQNLQVCRHVKTYSVEKRSMRVSWRSFEDKKNEVIL